jgi:signal transduction histidine kinase
MRLGLRGKILLITMVTPLLLGLAAYTTVNRSVRDHVDSSSIHESLDHSVRVFENMLAARGRALAGGAEVIARDPRFFSLLTLGMDQRDSRFVATVRGMAGDLNGITQAELFEVLDRRGRTLASVGSVHTSREARAALVREALAGHNAIGIVRIDSLQYQVSATTVRADGRVVGALLLGSEIGGQLARTLRGQMRSEVSFVAEGVITATTLDRPGDRAALLEQLATLEADPRDANGSGGTFRVRGEALTYVTAVHPIPSAPPGSRSMYVMQRAFDPETLFLRDMQQQLLFLGLAAVLAAGLTGFILSEKITRPIVQLVRGAQEMQRGNYDHPVPAGGHDEIGFLAERFNEMRRREKHYVGGLEEATRLKSAFIRVASTELRAPISVIEGYRELLASESLGPVRPEQRQALEAIRGGLERLTRMAEQATHAAQAQGERLELALETHPLESILDRARGEARAKTPLRRVPVQLDLPPDIAPLRVDGERLSHAIAHLVTACIEAVPDGGRVRIRVREHADEMEIAVNATADVLGPTEPVRAAPRDEAADAYQLGITRGIIEAHGGTLRVLDELGKTIAFRLTLPCDRGLEGRLAA